MTRNAPHAGPCAGRRRTPHEEAGALRGALGLALAGALLAACAGPAHPPAPANAEVTDARYVIGPLDTLNIVVWHNAELSTSLTVRPDGFISAPLVDDLRAAGRTPSQLRQDLEAALSTYLRDPEVSVIVSGFQGVYANQIRIVGEAAKPQAVPYRQDMTLLDVMIQVGGMTDFADGNAAVLIRGRDARQYSLRLKDLLKRGDISANVAVVPGDIIIVPQSWF